MANMIQLNIVGVQGKKTPLLLDQNSTIDNLFREAASKCGLNVSPDEIRLLYQGDELENLPGKTIRDYGFQNAGQIHMVVRVRGGWKFK